MCPTIIILQIVFLAFARGTRGQLLPRDIVNVGPSGVYPTPITCTALVQPVYYSSWFNYGTVIEPWMNGELFTINHAPTELCISSSLISTICPTSTITSSSLSTTLSITAVTSTTTSASITSVASAMVTQPSRSTTTGGTLFIGAGLPLGVYSDLPTNTFFVLGVAPVPSAGLIKRGLEGRQAGPMVTALDVVNLLPAATPGPLNQDVCDSAAPLLLQNGRLVQYSRSVNKYQGDPGAVLGFLDNQRPDVPRVDATFVLTNGFLSWSTLDVGAASFYYCNGTVYAGFQGVTYPCPRVLVGAIAGQACFDRVQSTRPPNPTFTPPVVTSTTTNVSPTTSRSSQVQSASISSPSLSQTAASSSTISSGSSATTGAPSSASSAMMSTSTSVASISATPLGSTTLTGISTSSSSSTVIMASSSTTALTVTTAATSTTAPTTSTSSGISIDSSASQSTSTSTSLSTVVTSPSAITTSRPPSTSTASSPSSTTTNASNTPSTIVSTSFATTGASTTATTTTTVTTTSANPVITCPNGQIGTVFTAGTSLYVLCPNTDVTNSVDLAVTQPNPGQAVTPQSCAVSCSANPNCRSAFYYPGAQECYLKVAGFGGAVNRQITNAVFLLSAPSSTTSASPTPTTILTSSSASTMATTTSSSPIPACPQGQSGTVITSGTKFYLLCPNTDVSNTNNLAVTQPNPASPQNCADSCTASASCRSAVYFPGTPDLCYLKVGSFDQAVQRGNTNALFLLNPSSSTPSSTISG